MALGGGAARGLAHLGVLEVLLARELVPSVVVGTSFGALAGALVAARGLSPAGARAAAGAVVAYAQGEAFRRSKLAMFRQTRNVESAPAMTIRDVVRRGLMSAQSLPAEPLLPASQVAGAIDAVVPNCDVATLPCVFGTTGVDLDSGEELLMDSGALRLVVRASCAIPGLMEPVTVGRRRVLDGGWAIKVPAGPARLLGAECVIAVDVSDELADTEDQREGLNVVHRGDAIRSHRLKLLQLGEADVVVRVDLRHIGWADFQLAEEIIASGRAAATAALPEVEAAVARARSPSGALARALQRLAARLGRPRSQPVRCHAPA